MISYFKESLLSEIESCLLSDSIHFSSQQKEVLRNNNTVNVIAGPGSGKTTVLIAKCALLLKSENHKDKGICVITHTNVAVDEIKSGLKKSGVNEINHPNFVGTIQEFIIQYFSRKAFHLFLKDTEMKILDTEEYYNQFCKVFSVLKPAEYSYNPPRPQYKKHNINFGVDFSLTVTSDTPLFYRNSFNDSIKRLLNKGFINNFQCLEFAKWYISNYQPLVREAIKNRFFCVLLDEAQDTSVEQFDILNKVFLGNIPFQRFGDPCQSLYTIFGNAKDAWVPFEEEMERIEISETVRFGEAIAKHVRNVATREYSELASISLNQSYCPYFITYNSTEELVEKYEGLIKNTTSSNVTYKSSDKKDSIISLKHEDLKAVFEHYEKSKTNVSTSQSLVIKMYNTVVKIIAHEMHSSIKASEELLKTSHEVRIKIAEGIKRAYSFNEFDCLLEQIEHFCEQPISNSRKKEIELLLEVALSDNSNFLAIEDLEQDIYIGTIHSVKGETHRSTLLLLNSTLKNHIFEVLQLYFIGAGIPVEKLADDIKDEVIKFLKLAYVAFSRPTHLLVIGIEESLLTDEYKTSLVQYGWQEQD